MFDGYQLLVIYISVFILITIDHLVQMWLIRQRRTPYQPLTQKEIDKRIEHVNSARGCAIIEVKR